MSELTLTMGFVRSNVQERKLAMNEPEQDSVRLDSRSRRKPLLFSISVGVAAILMVVVAARWSLANVTTGGPDSAHAYYRSVSKRLAFSTPDQIESTTLDDVATYLGYAHITGNDMQDLPSEVLMDPTRLTQPCTAQNTVCLRNRDAFVAGLGSVIPLRSGDILSARFFAPKIMNIKDPEATRKLGWRKLVRLRARPGSAAEQHGISAGILLFNTFTIPNNLPTQSDESVNTQVMLLAKQIFAPGTAPAGVATLYWLDYDRLSKGGAVSLKLDASFDANELPGGSDGTRSYFVPDGCVACHGNNGDRSLVNYLDTDHWFDRLDTDFPAVKAANLPLLLDAGTNDTKSSAYVRVFDVIRRFNEEADAEVQVTQPKHDETKASKKWLELHLNSDEHFGVADRAIGDLPRWTDSSTDVAVLGAFNQYCFRCHGTVKFSVFDKQAVRDRAANMRQRLKPTAAVGDRMPPDRPLPEDVRVLLDNFLKGGAK